MNRFSSALTLLALGSLTNVFSQVDYQPGYVVSLEGDTLQGSIDYRNWERNPKTISFRASGVNMDHIYKPLEIRAFGVATDVYESAIVQIDISPTQVGQLTESPEPVLQADTAFLRALIIGEKSLYHYHSTQRGSKEQFYIKKHQKWELLIYKKYTIKQNPKERQDSPRVFVSVNKRYVTQLAFYLQDCPTIQQKMQGLRYTSSSLEHLYQVYYQCNAVKPAYKKKEDKRSIEFGILAGGANTSIKFKAPNSAALASFSRAAFSNDVAFVGGIFMDVNRARNNRRWSLNNELIYTSFQSEGTYYVRNYSPDDYEYTHIALEYLYLKLNTMIRFKYPIGNFYIFANVGISNGLIFRESDHKTYVRKLYNLGNTSEGKAFENGVRRYDLGIFGGLGVRYQRYAVETRYEKGQGFIDFQGMRAPLSRLFFVLSFRLTK